MVPVVLELTPRRRQEDKEIFVIVMEIKHLCFVRKRAGSGSGV